MDRREFLGASAATVTALTASPLFAAQSGPTFRPEDFGAKGDGRTNDTTAFQRLAKRIVAEGGGTIVLQRGRTYVIGRQSPGADNNLPGEDLIAVKGLTRPFALIGNGARLLAAPGLRFGRFDTAGNRLDLPMPNVQLRNIATVYSGMIDVRNSQAPILIRDLILDGNMAALNVGGQYGDKGWQLPGDGIFLSGNLSDEQLVNIITRNHGRDGVQIDGVPQRKGRTRLERVRSLGNGRQGLSIVAGRGFDIVDCDFSHTGRGAVSSAPGGGVDIEAEKLPIRDLHFVRCRFADNAGVGMVADSGDSADARFDDCTFIGTTAWSAWPNKPGFRFNRCTFGGAVVRCFSDKADAARSTRFTDCLFTDDPKLADGHSLYVAGAKGGPIVDMGGNGSYNILFDRCRFNLVDRGLLPWSWNATYQDCTMRQASKQLGYPKGKYLGTNRIDGNVDLYGTLVIGTLVANGKAVAKGQNGSNKW